MLRILECQEQYASAVQYPTKTEDFKDYLEQWKNKVKKDIRNFRVKSIAHIIDVLLKGVTLHIFAYHIINPEKYKFRFNV